MTGTSEDFLRDVFAEQALRHAEEVDYDRILANEELSDLLIKKIVGQGRVASSILSRFIAAVGEKLSGSAERPQHFREAVLRATVHNPLFKKRILKKLVYEAGTLESYRAVVLAAREPLSEKIQAALLSARWLILAFLLFGISLMLPTPAALPVGAHRALSVFVLAIVLWISEAIPLPVTSLVVCVMLSLLGVVDSGEAFAGFGNHTVFFLMGALLLGVAITKVDLHKRISLTILRRVGTSPDRIFGAVVIISCVMSMLMNEHGVAAMMFPVVVAIVGATGVKNLSTSNFGKAMLLGLAYGCSVGSMGTLLGGGRNPLAIAIYQEMVPGGSISFFGWMKAAIPLVVVMCGLTIWVVKGFFPFEKIDLVAAKIHVRNELNKLGKMRFEEKKVLSLFAVGFVLWVTLGTTLGLAVVGIGLAAALFMTKAISWRDAEQGIPWGILFLYGGAISLGKALAASGAADFLGNAVLANVGSHPTLIIFVLVVLTIGLTAVMSNAAAVGVILPVAITALASTGTPGIVAVYVTALPAALGFLLPISTPGNAIVYSSGYLQVKDLLNAGMWLSLIGMIVFMTLGLSYWKLIGLL